MKKILIFTNEFPPKLGGAGGVALQLAKEFSEDNEVTVVTAKKVQNFFYNQYSFCVKPVRVIRFLWYISYFFHFKLHKLSKYDVIILNDSWAIYSAGLFFKKSELNKSIIYIHGIEKYIKNSNKITKLIRFEKLFSRAIKNSKKIICVSNFIKKRVSNDLNLKSVEDKVEVVYNGVNKKEIYYEESNLREELNISKTTKLLLSVGRVTEKKGYLKKMEIFKKLLKKNSDYCWLIVGDGDFMEVLSNLIKEENLENKIILLGKKDRNELKKYYSAADIFWLLSDYEEAFPLVYYEAQACNTIPVGWDKGGVKEVINSEVGLLATSEEEVINFIEKGYKKIEKKMISKKIITSTDMKTRLENFF